MYGVRRLGHGGGGGTSGVEAWVQRQGFEIRPRFKNKDAKSYGAGASSPL